MEADFRPKSEDLPIPCRAEKRLRVNDVFRLGLLSPTRFLKSSFCGDKIFRLNEGKICHEKSV